jgi:hypothetical protein
MVEITQVTVYQGYASKEISAFCHLSILTISI